MALLVILLNVLAPEAHEETATNHQYSTTVFYTYIMFSSQVENSIRYKINN